MKDSSWQYYATLAKDAYSRRDYERARDNWLLAQAELEDDAAFDDEAVLECVDGLAESEAALGNLDEAAKYYRRNLVAKRQRFGDRSRQAIKQMMALSKHYYISEEMTKAELLIVEMLKILEGMGAVESDLYAISLISLAKVYYHKQELAKAERCYKDAISLLAKVKSLNTPILSGALKEYASLIKHFGEESPGESTLSNAIVDWAAS